MAGETILIFGPKKILETGGPSIVNNALAQADDADYCVIADGGCYPDARFVATFTFAIAPTEGSVLALYAQPLDIDDAADAEAPETTRPTVFVGSFIVNNVTSPQSADLVARDVPWRARYYLHNVGTGQTVSAGWKLTVTPFTVAPAP